MTPTSSLPCPLTPDPDPTHSISKASEADTVLQLLVRQWPHPSQESRTF